MEEGTHQKEKQIILINRINQKQEVNVRGLKRSIKAHTKQHRWKIYGICRFNNL